MLEHQLQNLLKLKSNQIYAVWGYPVSNALSVNIPMPKYPFYYTIATTSAITESAQTRPWFAFTQSTMVVENLQRIPDLKGNTWYYAGLATP